MRVLVVCTHSDEAGAPLHVETVIAALEGEVEFSAVFGEEGPVAERLRARGVPVELAPGMRSSISPLRDLRAYRALSRHIARIQPDLIHAHSSKAAMLARVAALRHGRPCLYTVHGWGWRGLGRVAGGLVYALERLLALAMPRAGYVYVSRSVEREAWGVLGIPERRGRVIYNGVHDLGVRPEPEGRLRILMPARVSRAKDHESLVRAFERLDFDAELVLCGGGTETGEFRDALRRWAPSRHDRVLGLGQRGDVPELLHGAHVLALISHFEALPISIIEAMSAARSIVATDVGGVGELIEPGVNGLLVPRGDVAAIAAALTSLRDAETRARLGAAARRAYAGRFTAEAMAAELLGVYRGLVGEPQHG